MGGHEERHWYGCSSKLTSPNTPNQINLALTKLPCSKLGQQELPLHLIHQHAEPELLAKPKINDARNDWLKNSLGSPAKRERS